MSEDGEEKLVSRIAYLVGRYVEYIWPQLEKQGGVPDTPMNRKERGKSSPALSERGLAVIHANRTATKYLRFYLEFFENSERKAENGVFYSEVLRIARYSPGDITNWRAERTDEDKEMLEAFGEVKRQVAKGVIFTFGEKHLNEVLNKEEDDPDRFYVEVHPKDEQLETTEQARVKDAARGKSHNAHTRYRKLIAETDAVMEENDCTFKDSWGIVNERRAERQKDLPPALKHLAEPVSPATFERARRFVKGELEEGKGFSRITEEAS